MPKLITLNNGEDRDAWLAARIPVITATQAAAIVGSHPYTKLIDVWNEKTDPDHDPDALRNRWLEERAQLGNERELEIVSWASLLPETGGPGAPFLPNRKLLTLPEFTASGLVLPPAATPDASKVVGGKLVLLECKTTQQDWARDGLPQHIYDQCLWQLYALGAVTVWVAGEMYEWTGKGKDRIATLVGRFLVKVRLTDPGAQERLDFIIQEVEKFRTWYAEGIAPESDIDMREVDFDASPEDVETFAEADALLDELAEIEAQTKPLIKRADEIKAKLKPIIKGYDGRRVHLIGSRYIVKLVRFNTAKEDLGRLDPNVRRSITTYSESERVNFEVNPEWSDPD